MSPKRFPQSQLDQMTDEELHRQRVGFNPGSDPHTDLSLEIMKRQKEELSQRETATKHGLPSGSRLLLLSFPS